jgi:hypothetical protein
MWRKDYEVGVKWPPAWELSVDRHFRTVGCEDRTWAREAEEYPLLETVARERLVNKQQTGKDLPGAVVICGL